MGCDGGTIPKRDELVRTKKKGEQKDKSADLNAKWQHCALSSNKLSPPIVGCPLGRLYNKEAIIEYLLNKDSSPNGEIAKHIRSLKDVVTLNLTEKPEFNEKHADNGGEYVDTHDARFMCPVVGLEMNGKYKFCYIRTCGCVLSERALKEVKSDSCHKCNKEFSMDNDVIILNGNDEEMEQLKSKMIMERAKAKDEKKNNKKRKASETVTSDHQCSSSAKSLKSDSINNNNNTKPSSSSVLSEKARKEYSVAKDPNASETYKSLFTSHDTAKNQQKAHWVTFNPLYY